MAAEKVNTRQKMINMMYLVFIAMLALNISKEVLGTLGILSEDMEKSTAELKSSIDDLYTTIDLNSNQDYYKIPSEELPKLRDLTDDYWSYIQMLKDSLISLQEVLKVLYYPNHLHVVSVLLRVALLFISYI